MRDRRVRVIFVGLILALPLAIRAAAPPGGGGAGWPAAAGAPDREPIPDRAALLGTSPATVAWVEATVAGGLGFALRQRRSLLRRRGIRWSEPLDAFGPRPRAPR